ncbi:hypothetical protein Fot_04918 [Forsythia ovata]|uniref:Uncharacterized protein n=1 Tax=Forsythia ovata TaxID=205694 RepID=A0ABD1WNQ2_9LAMI
MDRIEYSICKKQSSHFKDNIISFITKLGSKIESVIGLSMDPLERSYEVGRLISVNVSGSYWLYTLMGSEFMVRVERYLLLVNEFSLFFSIPKLQMSSNSATPNNINELVLVFIDFLLEVLAKFDWRESYLKGQNQILQTELKLLIAYLGDTPSQAIELEETKSILTDIEALVNEVGSFLYFGVFHQVSSPGD